MSQTLDGCRPWDAGFSLHPSPHPLLHQRTFLLKSVGEWVTGQDSLHFSVPCRTSLWSSPLEPRVSGVWVTMARTGLRGGEQGFPTAL